MLKLWELSERNNVSCQNPLGDLESVQEIDFQRWWSKTIKDKQEQGAHYSGYFVTLS